MRTFCTLLLLGSLLWMPLFSCNEQAGAAAGDSPQESGLPSPPSAEFSEYWYQGEAEITSYKLIQARYGELHEGTAVTVFVTEDFSASKQVKLDRPESAGIDKIPVLKCNLVKKFVTGIYPYSMMLSVFQPVEIETNPHSLKTAASVQEWCGTSFLQLNRNGNGYDVQLHSYFESEGDRKQTFENCFPEDELWTLIRLAPDKLPTGIFQVLPGSFFMRLTHVPLKIQQAEGSIMENDGFVTYTVKYPALTYELRITFEKNFPHRIFTWQETYPGFDGEILTTTASRLKMIRTDYWNHHSNEDRALRESLGLQSDF